MEAVRTHLRGKHGNSPVRHGIGKHCQRHHLLTLERIFVCDSDLGKLLATSMTFLSSWIPDLTSARRRCSLIEKINPTYLVLIDSLTVT